MPTQPIPEGAWVRFSPPRNVSSSLRSVSEGRVVLASYDEDLSTWAYVIHTRTLAGLIPTCRVIGPDSSHTIEHLPEGPTMPEYDEPTYDTSCYECGEELYWDDVQCCEDCGVDLCYSCECSNCASCNCDDCRGYHSNSEYGIRPWNYRPSPYRPKGNYPGEVLMGLELEVGGYVHDISAVVRKFDAFEDHLYMKEDGSIDGVEIVTHPMTLDYARSYPFTSMLLELQRSHVFVNADYGLHVHVSRNAFRQAGRRSASHQMAWLMFLYRNQTELQLIARRKGSRWAAFKTPRPGELVRKAQGPDHDDRYVAVNCNNERTYELRFFKSTLDARELYAALELADASVEYTRLLKASDILRGNALSWDRFMEWAQGRGYENLSKENDERVNVL